MRMPLETGCLLNPAARHIKGEGCRESWKRCFPLLFPSGGFHPMLRSKNECGLLSQKSR